MRFRRPGFHVETDPDNIFLQEDLPVESAEKVEVIRLGGEDSSAKISETRRRASESTNHEKTSDEKSHNLLELGDFAPSLPELEPAPEIYSLAKEENTSPDQSPDFLEFDEFVSFKSEADEIAYSSSDYILGSGTFGEVRVGLSRTGVRVAVKVMTTYPQLNSPENVFRELSLMKTIEEAEKCNFFCRLHTFYKNDFHYIFVMDLEVGGCLSSHLASLKSRNTVLSKKSCAFLLRELVSAVYHLHTKCNIVHRYDVLLMAEILSR